ncbi:MAG: acetyl-CoA carboxylase carboxyl transferase subunit alpha, partial [Oscillospiraceae bacterium]|nr:acetyl-CoA carboxylase carboxyl transferase subunit alpha [Oscillospiraceae bacterium]
SPEGCASILWKEASPENVAKAAECLHITAQDMKNLGVAEAVIQEDFENFFDMCEMLKNKLIEAVEELIDFSEEDLLEQRYRRFRKFGVFEEEKKGFFRKK